MLYHRSCGNHLYSALSAQEARTLVQQYHGHKMTMSCYYWSDLTHDWNRCADYMNETVLDAIESLITDPEIETWSFELSIAITPEQGETNAQSCDR